jgi:hypothetical protein
MTPALVGRWQPTLTYQLHVLGVKGEEGSGLCEEGGCTCMHRRGDKGSIVSGTPPHLPM